MRPGRTTTSKHGNLRCDKANLLQEKKEREALSVTAHNFTHDKNRVFRRGVAIAFKTDREA